MSTQVVSPSAWLIARKELLVKEKEATRVSDALAAERRQLPMVKVTKPYTFTGPRGKVSLLNLFEGHKQLILYHFMLGPDSDEGCSSCSFFADHVPDLRHLQSRNTNFVMVCRAPIDKIEAFKKRMGWKHIPWYSSFGEGFNYDFHVTIDESVTPVTYNYDDKEILEKKGLRHVMQGEQTGFSVFYHENGDVFHTYSLYGRGGEKFLSTYAFLDITPLGRQEVGKGGIGGFAYHDQYTAGN